MSRLDAIVARGLISCELPPTGRFAEHRKLLVAQSRKFVEAKNAILADPNLSDQGKREKIQEAAQAALDEISKGKATFLVPERQALANLMGQLVAKTAPTTELSAVLREQEIRRYLTEAASATQHDVLVNAIKSNDEVVIRAFAHTPAGLNLLNGDYVQEARTALQQILAPDLANRVGTAEQFQRNIDLAHDDVCLRIRMEAGIPNPNPAA